MNGSVSKGKGTRWESWVENYLNERGVAARRLARAGVKDIGDIAWPLRDDGVLVVEAKARRATDLATWVAEAELEAQHYNDKHPGDGQTFGVVVSKRRGKSTGQAYVVIELDTFRDLIGFLEGKRDAK